MTMTGARTVGAQFRLGELLEKAGLSQSELARQSGISFVTINRIVANKTDGVSLKTLDAISQVLGCEPGDLLEREPRKRAK